MSTVTDESVDEGVDESEGVTRKPRGPLPEFKLEKVGGDLPSDPNRRPGFGSGGRRGPSMKIYNMLDEIKQDEDNLGEWFCIGVFHNPTGARLAMNGIVKGNKNQAGDVVKTPIPSGEWDFETRRWVEEQYLETVVVDGVETQVPMKDAPRGSKLFACWLGD